jgi:hypothetical protein
MNEKLFSMILGAILGGVVMNLLNTIDKTASPNGRATVPEKLPTSPPAVQATKIGPVQAIWANFGKQTHVWIVAPVTGKTLEIDVTESEITVPNHRRIGEAP